MKKIRLKCGIDLENSPFSTNPVYAFESNYCVTSKYSCWQKIIYEASVTVLLFSDRIALVPRSREGFKIIHALKNLIGLENDRIIPSAQSVIIEKNIAVSTYVDKIAFLLSNFEADPNFGLYGFFTYELINMKLGVDVPDMPLGIFYLPEIMSVNQGAAFRYSMEGGCNISLECGEPFVTNYEDAFRLSKFSTGESGAYEHLYDLCQHDISSRKIRSVNPSFTISKETKINPYEMYERLKLINPAPYNFYMSYCECDVVGSSPAMFMRMK
jgi:anthranilate synthase